jgi:hypothetical protein
MAVTSFTIEFRKLPSKRQESPWAIPLEARSLRKKEMSITMEGWTVSFLPSGTTAIRTASGIASCVVNFDVDIVPCSELVYHSYRLYLNVAFMRAICPSHLHLFCGGGDNTWLKANVMDSPACNSRHTVAKLSFLVSFRWLDCPHRAKPSPFTRFLDHTRHTTVYRTPLDERSALQKDLYLTTQTTHNRQTSMPPVRFEPTIPQASGCRPTP